MKKRTTTCLRFSFIWRHLFHFELDFIPIKTFEVNVIVLQVFVIGLLVSLIKCREPDDFDPEMDDMDSDEELIT